MDWIYSWKDSIFYGMCSCSGSPSYHEKDVPHPHDRLDMPLQLKAYRLVTDFWNLMEKSQKKIYINIGENLFEITIFLGATQPIFAIFKLL